MRGRLLSLIPATCAMVVAPAALAQEREEDVLTVATALVARDWPRIEAMGERVRITQDRKSPIVPEVPEFSIDNARELLADCRFTAMAADIAPALSRILDDEDGDLPISKATMGWFCSGFRAVEVTVMMDASNFYVGFKRRGLLSDRRIAQMQRTGSNELLVLGLKTEALSDPDFEVGSGFGDPKDGEPLDADLTAAALEYFAAIGAEGAGEHSVGLDLLDYRAMRWSDKESRKFRQISFEQVREQLEPCKLYEGRPRRFDRDGERVLAFDSGWRCLGEQGPYSNTLFLEMKDGKVAGGRLIVSSGREDRAAVAVPSVVAPAGAD